MFPRKLYKNVRLGSRLQKDFSTKLIFLTRWKFLHFLEVLCKQSLGPSTTDRSPPIALIDKPMQHVRDRKHEFLSWTTRTAASGGRRNTWTSFRFSSVSSNNNFKTCLRATNRLQIKSRSEDFCLKESNLRSYFDVNQSSRCFFHYIRIQFQLLSRIWGFQTKPNDRQISGKSSGLWEGGEVHSWKEQSEGFYTPEGGASQGAGLQYSPHSWDYGRHVVLTFIFVFDFCLSFDWLFFSVQTFHFFVCVTTFVFVSWLFHLYKGNVKVVIQMQKSQSHIFPFFFLTQLFNHVAAFNFVSWLISAAELFDAFVFRLL